jgi:hypothetical protein
LSRRSWWTAELITDWTLRHVRRQDAVVDSVIALYPMMPAA